MPNRLTLIVFGLCDKILIGARYGKKKKRRKINVLHFFAAFEIKGAVSRNSAKLGHYKMPVKLRGT